MTGYLLTYHVQVNLCRYNQGVGTLRRNPDMKLYFNRTHLDELVELQQQIFDKAIKLLKKDGKIVYVTCSFLKAVFFIYNCRKIMNKSNSSVRSTI